jgi:PAS domain-containing protein
LRIVLSGHTDINTLVASVNEGEIYKFLNKPWDDTELKLHIRRALEQHSLRMENRRLIQELKAQNRQLERLNAQLKQLSEDARTGQSSTQTMMEHLGIGVVVIDPEGLIVYANRWVCRYVAGGTPDLIGAPVREVLPAVLHEAGFGLTGTATRPRVARLELYGRKLECRSHAIPGDGGLPNRMLTVWEELP